MRHRILLASIVASLACTPRKPSEAARGENDVRSGFDAVCWGAAKNCTPAEAEPSLTVATAEPPPKTVAPPKPCPADDGKGWIEWGTGKSPLATTEAQCAACDGDWGPHGITGNENCLCATPDAGKACKSPKDCAGECLVLDPNASSLAWICPSIDAVFPGNCASTYVVFGCHARIAEKPTANGPLRRVQWICVD